MMNNIQFDTVFTKNRAEEIGDDVWEQFVIPPFFDKLDLHVAVKLRIIIGGRGCGKTMLLRYLSHQTTFSPNRKSLPANALDRIGVYWKVDTNFAHSLQGRGIESNE